MCGHKVREAIKNSFCIDIKSNSMLTLASLELFFCFVRFLFILFMIQLRAKEPSVKEEKIITIFRL